MQELIFHAGYSTIIFDCDFTLSKIQGINELANSTNNPAIAELIHNLTMQVVTGKKTLEQVFFERLKLAKPTQKQLLKLGQKYIKEIVKDAQITIEALQYLDKKIYIMSHGYKTAIAPLAEFLKIPSNRVFAVELQFDQNGNYQSLDLNQPLVQSNGKRQLIAQLGVPQSEIMFIGDGPLDLDVKDCVGIFLGFGGVKEHKIVKKSVKYYLTGESLLPVLFIATSNLEKNLLQSTKYLEAITKSFILSEKNLKIFK